MKRVKALPDVLTLEEAAAYLRLSKGAVKKQAEMRLLPGRKVDRQWRFLKAALDDWLRGQDKKDSWTALSEQFGVFKDDETLLPMLEEIYKARGRPMVEEGSES